MDKVLVLMSTYNGEKYIREQLNSILNQKGVDVHILVRDDGSNDSTINILKEYEEEGKINWYAGENLGPARSFMHLIMNAPQYDYYALCDQDDVWIQGKLETAIGKLKGIQTPVLYYHAMNLVDSDLKKYGYYFRKEEDAKSLMHSCLFGDEIAGCTMVFNNMLMKSIKEYNPRFLTMHDGWIHRVCLCVGGEIIADQTAYINYRQHGKNVVGMSKRSISNQVKTLRKKEKKFSRIANEMLNGYSKYLKSEEILFLKKLSSNEHYSNKIYVFVCGNKCTDSLKEKVKLGIKLIGNSL